MSINTIQSNTIWSDGVYKSPSEDSFSISTRQELDEFIQNINKFLLLKHIQSISTLPNNYTLYQSLDKSGISITGHPSGLVYDSLQEFVPHVEWLVLDPHHDSRTCVCRCCFEWNQDLQNSNALLGDRDLASTNDSMIDDDMDSFHEDPQSVQEIDYATKIPELKEFILASQGMNARASQVLQDAQQVIVKLKFENKILVEELHERNSKFFDPIPFSASKRLYEELEKREVDSGGEEGTLTGLTGALGAGEEDKKKKTPKRRRGNKTLDPLAPKRPINAFMVYSELERSSFQQERKDLQSLGDASAVKNLSKIAAARWKAMSPNEKQKYKNIYKEKMEIFEKEMLEYSKTHPDMASNVVPAAHTIKNTCIQGQESPRIKLTSFLESTSSPNELPSLKSLYPSYDQDQKSLPSFTNHHSPRVLDFERVPLTFHLPSDTFDSTMSHPPADEHLHVEEAEEE